ncbi:uncharacterized protein TNCV_985181 [Trichonephila clavipes]|nr:uncharacterized protein TNCV_985181 [Trichonephila clavipes]
MDVCKCIVPSWHGGTLNSRRAASPLVRLVEGEEGWKASDHSQSVLPQNWGETEPNRFVTYGDRFNSCQVIYSQFGLQIHQNDHQARRRFVEWAQNEIAVVPDFHKRILSLMKLLLVFFSDEAHFWLNGYVNKQNCHIWSEANPQVYVETPLHPEKLTVWGAELWFQQDGATCHTARATIDLLKDTFGDCLISRFGSVNWPPRSCDLTPLDYFLWGYVKSLVYADKPQTLEHLEDNIRRVIADIRPQMLEKVFENWTTSEPAVAVLCQKSYLKCNATRLSFE